MTEDPVRSFMMFAFSEWLKLQGKKASELDDKELLQRLADELQALRAAQREPPDG